MKKTKVKYRHLNFYIYDASPSDHIVSHFIKFGEGWESDRIDYIKEHISNSNRCMIDVGGEIGAYSTILAEDFKKIYTFEPNIKNCEMINDTIAENNINNITLYNYACGNVNTNCNLTGPYDTRVKIGEGDIKVVRIDDIVDDDICFIKIDVEGFEYNVLLGCEKIIDKYRPVIYLETHPTIVESSKRDCEEWLTNKGYKVYKSYSGNEWDKFWKYYE